MIDLKFHTENAKRVSIVTGHYGSGKTNIAVNMALKLKKDFPDKKVTIVDLDIVNPYFHTADFTAILENHGIRVITPTYANTNLDTPVLPAEINAVFDLDDSYVVIDVGGDDAGAIALGRYSKQIAACDFEMYYVVNQFRLLTNSPSLAVELMTDIESCARVKVTKLINNSNLGTQTTLTMVTESLTFAEEICALAGVPLAFCTINDEIDMKDNLFEPINMYVKPLYAGVSVPASPTA